MLVHQGRYGDAVPSYRRRVELEKTPPGQDAAREWLAAVEWRQRVEAKLPVVVRGEVSLAPGRRLNYVEMCREKGFYGAAVRLTAEALAAQPALALDRGHNLRFFSAWCAILAASGQGKDSAGLSAAERARLRRQALTWLRGELTMWGGKLSKDRKERRAVEKAVRVWHYHRCLAPVRGADIDRLPADEQPGWRKLWADVTGLLKRCEQMP
jgi:hypothetical protein